MDDIHGRFSHLGRSFKVIGFDERVDRLFSVGNLVGRGSELEQMLDWLDEPWFHATCGNHDFMARHSPLDIPYQEVDQRMCGDALDIGCQAKSARTALTRLPLALEVQTPSGLGRLGTRGTVRSTIDARCRRSIGLRSDQQIGRAGCDPSSAIRVSISTQSVTSGRSLTANTRNRQTANCAKTAVAFQP